MDGATFTKHLENIFLSYLPHMEITLPQVSMTTPKGTSHFEPNKSNKLLDL